MRLVDSRAHIILNPCHRNVDGPKERGQGKEQEHRSAADDIGAWGRGGEA